MKKDIIRLLPSTSNPSANDLPMVIQYKKRDLQNALPTQVLGTNLGYSRIPEIEVIAREGIDHWITLKAILNWVIIQVQTTV